ncbi:MAG: DUF5113 domain-containing protein [Phocaeicola sp.]
MKNRSYLPLFLLVLMASGALFSCTYTFEYPNPQADSLNVLAYQLHYKDLVASNVAASQALKVAGKSGIQRAEAYNNLAFCAFMKMDFERSEHLFQQVYKETTSELECLIADVGLMKICQRTAMNKEFYDYRNSALRRIERIQDDYASLSTPHELTRFHYGETEFHLTTAIYHYYLQQEQQSIEALDQLNLQAASIEDDAQKLQTLYLRGVGILNAESYEERIFTEFNQLLDLLRISHDKGYLYFEANASQALSELFHNDRAFSILKERRSNLIRMINPKDLPQDSLMITFAQRALELFNQYGDLYQISGAYRTLSAYYTKKGEYKSALSYLEKALSYVNLHHETYYHCTDTTDRLKTYVASEAPSLELEWIAEQHVKTIPEWIARIREQLSMTYAAMGMKPESDYNRNVYLDILDYTRQDKELLSRYNALEKESKMLTFWLYFVILGGVLMIFLLGWLNRLWRTKSRTYISQIKNTLAICKRITASVPPRASNLEDVIHAIHKEVGGELLDLLEVQRIDILPNEKDESWDENGSLGGDENSNVTPQWGNLTVFPLYTPDNSSQIGEVHLYSTKRLKENAHSLMKVIVPYIAWTLENGLALVHLGDECEHIANEQYLWEQRLAENKRQNVIKRACLFLVTGITPYMDRIINEVHKLVRYDYWVDKEVRQEKILYINELVGCINEYNEMLTKWIQMRQGSLNLSIENFDLQSLFDVLKKGKRTYEMKQQVLEVEPTTAWVKADKALTLFMLNTLADNARKYTQAGGTIRISAVQTENYVELMVEDNGSGLSPTDVEYLLSEKVYDSSRIGLDYSADKEALMKRKGGGFGLMNCKGIIEKYRKTNDLFRVCTFSITSTLGEGSRFSFRLPKGVKRAWMWIPFFLMVVTGCHSVEKEYAETEITSADSASVPSDSLLIVANQFTHQVYNSNVEGMYVDALIYADSALSLLNQYSLQFPELNIPLLKLDGEGRAAELKWLAKQVDVNYYTLLDLRNEAAVAYLALGNLDAYRYNNNAYTTLYKQLSEDVSLEEYCQKMKVSSTNKSIAIVLCFILLLILLVSYYLLYLRRHLFYQYSLEQVLRVNKRAFQVLQTTRQEVDDVAHRLVNELFQEVNELIAIQQLAIAVCHVEGGELHYAFSHSSEESDSLQEVMARSFVNKAPLWQEQSSFKALPLWVESRNEKICIGVLALQIEPRVRQEDSRIMMEFIAGYVAVLIHTNLVLIEQKYKDIEVANDEARRIQREENLLHVQNLVLDNCLSTIKHETAYYPNKVKQLIEKLECEEWGDGSSDQVEAIGELMDYYKEVFTLLTSCAVRQLDEVTFKRGVIESGELAEYAKKQFAKLMKREKGQLLFSVELQDREMVGDLVQLKLLLELLLNEAIAYKEEGELRLSIYESGEFVRFDFTDSRRTYTQEELNLLFFPQLSRIREEKNGILSGTEYLISKQIIREHDEFAGRRGCRINAHPAEEKGYTVWFTIPLKKKRNE